MGDVLRTTSTLKGLKEKYNKSKIYWLISGKNKEIIIHNPFVDKILIYSKSSINAILKEKFDLVISLEDSAVLCRVAYKIKAKKLIGSFQNAKGILCYTEDLNDYFDMSLISKYGKKTSDQLKISNKKTYQDIIAKALGVKKRLPLIHLDNENYLYAEKFAKTHQLAKHTVIGLNTGAGSKWQQKKWSEIKTATLAKALAKQSGIKVVLFGGPGASLRNKRIIKYAENSIIDTGCYNNFSNFAALINLCAILVTSDSLALHAGTALKKYVIALFGPTSSSEIDLFGRGEKIVPKIPCLCCYKNICKKKPNCMDSISVDNVLKFIKRAISLPSTYNCVPK